MIQSVSLIDEAALGRLQTDICGGDIEMVREFIDLFLADTPAQIQALKSGVETGDSSLLERAAHTLKSSAATMGASLLALACEELERLGRLQNLADAEPRVAALEQIAADSIVAFRTTRESL
jgi:HPt (histidine-containing phosphotransfer) domain-containing protein